MLLHQLKLANFDLVPSNLYEAQHESHEKGYSLLEVMDRFKDAQFAVETEGLLSLDEVIDIPFQKNKMVKVEAPVVPNVRASSFDSVDSIRFEH